MLKGNLIDFGEIYGQQITKNIYRQAIFVSRKNGIFCQLLMFGDLSNSNGVGIISIYFLFYGERKYVQNKKALMEYVYIILDMF